MHRCFIPIDRFTRIILVGVNHQVAVEMWAMVTKYQIIDFGGLVQVIQHLGDAGNILPELGKFLNREFEQLIGVASKDDHGVAWQILISGQSDNALLEFGHFEAKAIFFQMHIFTYGAIDPLFELFPLVRQFPFHRFRSSLSPVMRLS